MPRKKPADIRAVIDKAAADAGLSRAELARRAACSQPNLNNYLNGKRDLRTDVLGRLMVVLRLELRSRRR